MIALALWLTAVALFYGITGSRDIRVIPLTLFLLAVGTFAGPLSVYSASAATEPVLGAALVAQATAGDASPGNRYGQDAQAAALAGLLGVVYVDRWESVSSRFLNVYVDHNSNPLSIAGFDYLLQGYYGSAMNMAVGTDSIRVVPSNPPGTLDVFVNGEAMGTLDLTPALDLAVHHPEAAGGNLNLKPDELQVETRNGNGRLRLVLDAMTLNEVKREWELMSSSGRLLIDLPDLPGTPR